MRFWKFYRKVYNPLFLRTEEFVGICGAPSQELAALLKDDTIYSSKKKPPLEATRDEILLALSCDEIECFKGPTLTRPAEFHKIEEFLPKQQEEQENGESKV